MLLLHLERRTKLDQCLKVAVGTAGRAFAPGPIAASPESGTAAEQAEGPHPKALPACASALRGVAVSFRRQAHTKAGREYYGRVIVGLHEAAETCSKADAELLVASQKTNPGRHRRGAVVSYSNADAERVFGSLMKAVLSS